MEPWHHDDRATIYNGDCLEVLRALPDASVDAVVTDPPYGLEFMGKDWDAFRPARDPRTARRSGEGAVTGAAGIDQSDRSTPGGRTGVAFGGKRPTTWRCGGCGKRDQFRNPHACSEPSWTLEIIDPNAPSPLAPFQEWCRLWAVECLRVLKPGGHLLAFGGTRTWHRLACAIEDAGFEVRDSIAWMYGSGFPKSLDVSKAIDKAAGAERRTPRSLTAAGEGHDPKGTLTGRLNATQWCQACGKSRGSQPANFQCDTVGDPMTDAAHKWSGWGTALKPAHEPIVVARKPLVGTVAANVLEHGTGALNIDACRIQHDAKSAAWVEKWSGHEGHPEQPGWGSIGQKFGGSPAGRWPANVVLDENQAAELDRQSGVSTSTPFAAGTKRSGGILGNTTGRREPMGHNDSGGASRFFYVAKAPARERPKVDGTAHPTVKPLTLMRWLCRLVTPPDGVILEPFAGSGTTVEAALLEGFRVVAIEREADYLPLIQARLDRVAAQEPEDEQLTLDASA
jgi:DNA modification methylase